MTIKIQGIKLGNIAGGPSSLNLSDLHDVSIVSPQTGQYLRYNAGILEWQNSSIDNDIYSFINTKMSGSQGVGITYTPGPNTIVIGLGNITPTSVLSAGSVTGSNLSGTNTGDQTIVLTGDVTGTGTGTFSTTLASVNSNIGTFGSSVAIPVVTVNGKGLVTAVSTVSIGGTTPLATSIAGGAAGSLLYQAATDTTVFLAAGTTNQVLISGASAPSWTNTPTLTGTNFTGIPNSSLINSSLTIGSTNIALGTTAATLVGLTSVSATTFIGSLSGNATTSTSLINSRNIGITGDATWSVSFSGNSDVTSILTLSAVNGSPQIDTFRKITVNSKGLTTATSPVSSSDITSSLGYTPVNIAGDTMLGNLILNADPTTDLGAATKHYVDSMSSGVGVHNACETSTTLALPSVIYNNGSSGVGATLTATSNGNMNTIHAGGTGYYSLDGLQNGDRLLVKNQVDTKQNGIYIVTNIGADDPGGAPFILTRSTDFDGSPASEVTAGALTYIQEGTLTGTQWVQTNVGTGRVVGPPAYDYVIVGVDPIIFSQFAGAGSYTAGTGINISSNSISNTGVLSNIAGTGIGLSGATGNVTISNTGVTSIIAGTNVSISSATGDITISTTGTIPTATTATNIAGGAAGSLPYQSASSITAMLAAGTTNQVLISGASAPSWTNTPTLTGTNFTGIPNSSLINSSLTIGSTNIALGATSATLAGLTSVSATTFTGSLSGNATTATTSTTATTATNLLGAQWAIPYQSALNTTSMLAPGTAGYVLTSNGSAAPSWQVGGGGNSTITNDISTNASMYPVWVTANAGSLPLYVSSTLLSFNPSLSQLIVGASTGAGAVNMGPATSGRNLSWGPPGTNYTNIWSSFSTGNTNIANGLRGSTTLDSYLSSSTVSSGRALIRLEGVSGGLGAIAFFTDSATITADGTSITPTERMRINNSGNIGINGNLGIGMSPSTSISLVMTTNNTNPNNNGLSITNSNSASVGNLWVNGTSGAGLPNWPYSTVLESVPASTGNLILSAFANNMLFQTGGSRLERMRIDTTGNIMIGTTTPSTILTVNGTVTATSFNSTSTKRVKKAIKSLSQTYIDKFSELKPREYNRRDTDTHEFGFVAEEMALVYPEIVGYDIYNKPSGIDYSRLSAILTAKVQEQQSVIEILQKQISYIMNILKKKDK